MWVRDTICFLSEKYKIIIKFIVFPRVLSSCGRPAGVLKNCRNEISNASTRGDSILKYYNTILYYNTRVHRNITYYNNTITQMFPNSGGSPERRVRFTRGKNLLLFLICSKSQRKYDKNEFEQ